MFQTLYTYKCTKGSCLCSFMCVFVGLLFFNILNSFWVVDGADRLFHLQLCYEILFLLRCGSCQEWSLVNRAYFSDFCTRPYIITHDPPLAPARPCTQPCSPATALRHAMQILGDSKISNAFNSKKRFFNEFKDLEDLEY